MKRIISRITALTLIMFIFIMSVPTAIASGAEMTKVNVNNIVYEIYDDYAILTNCKDKTISGKYVVPSTVNGKTICGIGDFAFLDCKQITEVVIPDCIESLGSQIFRNCTKLEKITVPKTVTSMHTSTFWGCKWYNNQPDGIIYVNDFAVDIKNGSVLGESITIANGTKKLADKFGYSEHKLKSLTIPDSVTEMGMNVFAGCENLENIKFSKNTEKIAYGAFDATKWLDTKKAEAKGDCYIGKSYFRYFGDLPANSKVRIKDGTVSITMYAFFFQKNLKEVILPESLKSIGDFAFLGCSSLEEVAIPAKTEMIGYQSFNLCTSLKKATVLNPNAYLIGVDDYDYSCVFTNEADYTADHSDFIAVYNGVIRGFKGSTAQKYAKKYGLKFEDCTNTLGDVNYDGSVDAVDASEILTIYAKTAVGENVKLGILQRFNANVNSDGDINAVDASLVLGYYAYKATGGKKSIYNYLTNR